MPIFISYSHADKSFVDKLAVHLVKHDAHVWVDRWELNVGDSIVGRVQDAIQASSALLIVLSKASVASEWCKKELNAGLVRELTEKKVVVLPVLVEDCEIPVFLREKMYADFRESFKNGAKVLVEAIAKVTKLDQGRLKSGTTQIDWSETWGYLGENFQIDYTLSESFGDSSFTVLTEISVSCDDGATRRYRQYEASGLDWFGRMVITEAICEFAMRDKIAVILSDQHPKILKFKIGDPKVSSFWYVQIRCRRMGEDNGKDQHVRVANYFELIRNHMKARARPVTAEELKHLKSIISD